LLEVDDYPMSDRAPCKGCGTSTHLDSRGLCRDCQIKAQQEVDRGVGARAAELAHAQKLARVEHEKAEATAHRMRLAGESTEKRRARAKSRHTKKGAVNRVNDKLHEIGRKYWPTVQDAYDAVISAVRGEGFVDTGEVAHESERDGNHLRVYGVEDDEGKQYGLSFSTYRMQSGRYEIVTYLS